MGELYLRKVVLEILPSIGSLTKIDGLRIKFTCEKTNESTPNTANIEVYNLSDRTRSLLESKNTSIRLSVGYLGLTPDGMAFTGIGGSSSVEQIFVGNVTKVTHKVDGPDIVSKIEVGDGDNRFRNSRLDKGYPPNTKLNVVLSELVTTMGLAQGAQVGIPVKNYSNGLTLSGLTRDHLDNLTEANGLEWSIQDESVQIIPKILTTLDNPILLSPDTGLIGSPSKTDKGVEFVSLLQPKLRPGRKAQVQSRFINGTFKIRKVTHQGDSKEGDFLSSCESTK